MTEALALGEKLLSLLHESARSSTYKPALLLALIDQVQEDVGEDRISVRALAERVIELYWPQTLLYPTTGKVLRQSQSGVQATIVSAIVAFREHHARTSRALPVTARRHEMWGQLVTRVEETLAEWPIPRLQRPYEPFLYTFDWPWQEQGAWSLRTYRSGERAITLFPGVAEALVSLGPLLRPFITRWWTDKAAQLNRDVEAAESVLEFEHFLFGRDRKALERIAAGLLELQTGACFYCRRPLPGKRAIDHFVPWSYSGDDGLDNLVCACQRCNGEKSATLAGPEHLADLLERNRRHDHALRSLAEERHWPRDSVRSERITRTAYLRSPDERPLWICTGNDSHFENLGALRTRLALLLG